MINSIPDLIVIGGTALLVFGPKRLPELAKALGSGIRDFKKALAGIESEEDHPHHELVERTEMKPTAKLRK